MTRTATVAALLAAAATTAHAQVVINEVFENPIGSGGTDDRFEYVELYGKPNLSLDGYVLALLKGGTDTDGDDIPGPNPGDLDPDDITPEIDELFSLDGLSLDSRGFLVIYNNTGSASFIPGFSPAGAGLAGWGALFVPSIGQDCLPESAGRFANDTSSTYILLRNPSQFEYEFCGQTDIGPWRKDRFMDVDFDGKIDIGTETMLPGVFSGQQTTALGFEPYQMVDEIAWSNAGGKEYVRTSENEISDTPGFNPDAVSRVNYFGANPGLGWRFNSSGVLVPTRTADEEWVYGEIPSLSTRAYDPANAKGPTDQAAPGYDGSCDPDTNPACTPGTGTLLFDDVSITGLALTPGNFNDGGAITQFRFTPGDFDFDGDADADDHALIVASLGFTGLEREPMLDEFGDPVIGPDMQPVMAFTFQGRAFNALTAMKCTDEADGPGGANAQAVTQDDIGLHDALYGPFAAPCVADVTSTGSSNGIPDGAVDISDYSFYLTLWAAGDSAADVTTTGTSNGLPDGAVDISDFSYYLTLWAAGCP